MFSQESNVLDPRGKSWAIKMDLDDQNAFVGGDYRELVKYFNREDVGDLWEFVPAGEVLAFAGFRRSQKGLAGSA